MIRRLSRANISLEPSPDQAHQQKRDALLGEVYTRLREKMEKRENNFQRFVARGSLQDIWSEDRLERFIHLFAPGFSRKSIPDVRQRYVQTLSILVWIEWDGWARFGTIFFRPGRADCDIPTYSSGTLEDPSFLGPRWGDKFFTSQYIFCPIDIVEGQNIVQTEGWRLPFLDRPGETRSGGFGEVVEEWIAKGHFRPLRDHVHREPLNEVVVVACKSFTTRYNFRHEVENLSRLRSSLSKCDRIVLSLATVTIEPNFHIIFPWATMDLEIFLEQGYQKFPNFTPQDLMKETSNLAAALSFLHDGLQPSSLKCHHMDLKPPNILVFTSADFPVGVWKITDFGISSIDEPVGHPTAASEFAHDHTYPPVRDEFQYHMSTYQPPEWSTKTGFGRGSDVWSLGCVSMRVLAFGLGGVAELQSLDEQRGLNDDDLLNSTNDRFYRGSPPVLNPHVESWLSALPSRYSNFDRISLERHRDLLFRMLHIEKDARPHAQDVFEELEDILKTAPLERNQGPARVGSVMTARSDPPSERDITATVGSLVSAIRHKSTHDMRALLNGYVMVEEKDEGDRPVVHAIRENFPPAIQMLRDYRQDLDLETPDSAGNTPLKLAAQIGSVEMVETLLAAGVDPNTPSSGMTPLMVAAQYGHGEIIETLLNHRADYTAYESHGYTCVHYAAINRQAGGDVISPFIGKIETVDILTQHDGQTPFSMLIKNFVDRPLWWEKFRILRENGANISHADASRMTPLSLAVRGNEAGLARILLNEGAKYGSSALPRNLYSDMNSVLKAIRESNDHGSIRSGRSRRSFFGRRSSQAS